MQGSPASSSFLSPAGSDGDANEPGEGGFRTFLHPKKSAKVTPHSSARVPQDVSSSTLSANQMAPGRSALLRSQDERTEMVHNSGHCAGLVLAEPGHWVHTVAPALGALRCLRFSSSTSWW